MANTKDETTDSRLFYRISSRAFMRDRAGNEYTGEQLMLALLLHAKGKRTKDQTDYVAGLMNDPNQNKRPKKKG